MEDEDFNVNVVESCDADEDVYDTWFCPDSSDDIHCNHWHDGEPCCYCGSDEGEIDE